MAIKPPVGLIPFNIFYNERVKQIAEAMIRYHEAGKDIPDLWKFEIGLINDLERKLYQHNETKI